MQAMRALPGVRVITLNHPRDDHTSFTPLGPEHFNPVSGAHLGGKPYTFDALEVVTSAAMQSDIMQLYHDWFAMLNHGYPHRRDRLERHARREPVHPRPGAHLRGVSRCRPGRHRRHACL